MDKRREKRVIENKSTAIKSSDLQVYKSQFALAYDLMTTATQQQQQCVDTNCTVTAIDNAMIKVLNGLLQNRYLFCIAKYPAA